MHYVIREATPSDARQIVQIYNEYIEHSVITFEEVLLRAPDIEQRIEQLKAAGLPWFVAADSDNCILGYAYAAPWRERSAYRHSVEVSIYLRERCKGQGLGTALYKTLFAALEKSDVHAALAGIALPNDASIALHGKFGMRKVAHLPEVGLKFGKWIDVAYWQRVF